MLRKLRLHNFRTYLNAEIEFGPRHLIIGKNNCGKSNLCMALRFLGATSAIPLSQAAGSWIPGGIPEMTNWGFNSKRMDFSIDCELQFQEELLRYRYDLSLEVTSGIEPTAAAGTLALRVAKERLTCDGGRFRDACLLENDGHEAHMLHEEQVGSQPQPYAPKTLSPQDATMLSKLYELQTNRRAIHFRRFLNNWAYFAFSPRQMRIGWREAGQASALWTHGDNLATVIFYLKNQEERRYRRLIERVNRIEPDLDAINFIAAPDQGIVPFISLRGRDRASWEGLSDGTLRALAMFYLIEEAGRLGSMPTLPAPFVMIEEPENGIYVGLLRQFLEEFESCAPQAQFIFTSHSPYVIDLFDRDLQNVTCFKKEGGVTTSRPLSDLKETIDRNRDQYDLSLGEQHYKEVFE